MKLAVREDLADASVPVLCAYGSDTDMVHVSPSTGYRILKEAHLSEPRGRARRRIPCLGLTMVWPWLPIVSGVGILLLGDLLRLGSFTYLYAILDEYSRYVVAWRLDWTVQAPTAREMFQEAIDSQHIVDLPEGAAPLGRE